MKPFKGALDRVLSQRKKARGTVAALTDERDALNAQCMAYRVEIDLLRSANKCLQDDLAKAQGAGPRYTDNRAKEKEKCK
jgi:uncharacterized coiled-coil DUF342 family protein